MARCWTCGESTNGFQYTCAFCQGLTQLKRWRKVLETQGAVYPDGIGHLMKIQREAVLSLEDFPAVETPAVASAIEWGFEDFRWSIHLQIKNLRNINRTLKTQTQIQANEWRELAEELRQRGVMAESEKFFLKALES